MVILAFVYAILSLIIIHFGLTIQIAIEKSIGSELKVNPIFAIWQGFAGLGIVVGVMNFIVPIGASAKYWVLLFIILTSIPFYKDLINRYQYIIERLKEQKWWYFAVLAFVGIVTIIAASDGPIYNLDPARYHMQIIEWAKEYTIVPGLGNLHVRYANYSSWHLFYALLDHGYWFGKSYHILNGLLFFHLMVFGFHTICNLFKKWTVGNLVVALSVLIVCSYSYYIFYWYLSCPTPDLSSFAFSFVGYCYFFQYICQAERTKDAIFHSMILASIVFAGYSFKLNGIFACVFLVFPFVKFVVMKWRSITWNLKIAFFVIPVMFVLLRFSQNEITSGFMLFPMTSIDVLEHEWQNDVFRVNAFKRSVRYSAFQKGIEVSSLKEQSINPGSKEFSVLFMPWLKGQFKYLSPTYFIIFSLLLILASIVIMRNRKDYSLFKVYWPSILFLSISLDFWYFSAPDIRFGIHHVAFLAGIGGGFLIYLFKDQLGEKVKMIPVAFVALFVMSFCSMLMKLTPVSVKQNHILYPIALHQYFAERGDYFKLYGTPQAPYHIEKVNDDLEVNFADYSLDYMNYGRSDGFLAPYFSPEEINAEPNEEIKTAMRWTNYGVSILCWNIPIPATLTIYPGLERRGESLGDGFIINPAVRRTEDKINKTH